MDICTIWTSPNKLKDFTRNIIYKCWIMIPDGNIIFMTLFTILGEFGLIYH